MRIIELIHGDLVGAMPVESVSRCNYGFILVGGYSQASLGAASVSKVRRTCGIREVGHHDKEWDR